MPSIPRLGLGEPAFADDHELSRFVGTVGKTLAEVGQVFAPPGPLMTITDVAALIGIGIA